MKWERWVPVQSMIIAHHLMQGVGAGPVVSRYLDLRSPEGAIFR